MDNTDSLGVIIDMLCDKLFSSRYTLSYVEYVRLICMFNNEIMAGSYYASIIWIIISPNLCRDTKAIS